MSLFDRMKKDSVVTCQKDERSHVIANDFYKDTKMAGMD